MPEKDFIPVFQELKSLLVPHQNKLIVKTDNDQTYYLDCPGDPYNKKRVHFFGSASIKKNYVSFYLMPVYTHPELLEGMSEGLKKRMQGKSCFNFKQVDGELIEELKELTQRGFETYLEVGYAK